MNANRTGLDVVTMGETMIAFEAQDFGPLRESHTFKKWIGGAEDNVAIGLARLGFRCGWISRVGDDEFGQEILRTIKGEGVDVSRAIVDSQAPTGVFFVERRSETDFQCYYYRNQSAASRLSPNDVDSKYIQDAEIVFLTGITPAVSASACAAVDRMFDIARSNGQPLVFDPNLRLKLWDIDKAREVLIPMMQKSEYVLPGEDELKQLMNCPDLDRAIKAAHQIGIRNLIVKRDAQGAAIAVSGRTRVDVPAFTIARPISSMGAGDCFTAGFVAGLLRNLDLAECVRWGNAMGAYCMMGWGPYQTLPNMRELNAFLDGSGMVAR